MFTRKKSILFAIVALCMLACAPLTSGQSGADVPPQVLQRLHDVDRLPDGHTLITDGGQPGGATGAQPGSGSKIIEVDEAGNVIWLFDQGLDWAHNADRLPSGNTLVSDTGHDRVIEIDAAGTVVWNSDDVTFSDGSVLDYPNDANWLLDDHLLITDRDNHRVIEIARDGTVIWQFGETGVPGNDDSHLGGPHNADRLPSGNIIVADSLNNRILEIAPDGSIVWQYPSSPATHTPTLLHPPLLDWPRDADRLSNGNTLITDSRHDRIIEVTPTGQVVWHYDDLELPYDADRLDNGNTLISGSPSGGVVEVDFAGDIVWQYPPAPTGTIAGTVQDTGGQPVSGVAVTVFGTSLSDTTDADGQYVITDVPVAAPRYIVTTSKAGYLDAQAGDVDATEGMTTTVDFALEAGTQVTETLHAMIGYIVYRDPSGELLIPPPTAVLSPTLYPAEVLPYLEPGQYIESDDPGIVAVAQSILAGLTPEQRTEQTTVAHAVYVWMVQNIAYDLTQNYPGDVTCGNWQTTYGAWGHSFADWLYTASELLEEGRGICIEHARLATALLRAVGIPARPAPLMAHPVTQWWVQLPDGTGFWANMDTSKGRSEYVDSGELWADFPSKEEHKLGFWAIDADGPIHLDWWTDNPCLWREAYGDGRRYPATADGLADAKAALAYFAQTGELPAPSPSPPPNEPYYKLSTRGFEIDLTNASQQTHFEVSFALAIETDYLQRIDQAHWTNHPDWVTSAYTTTQSSAETGESLVWYVLELDRPSLPPILASIVMHNEEPLSGQYPDFVTDQPAFWQHRNALGQFVDMLHDNGVMFNYQSDWNFLMAAGLYDTGTPETNGENIVRYIKDLGFEVDPHAHETQYNYADVAYLIEALGVTPSHTAGGFLAAPPEDSKLEYLWQPLTATLSSTYTWQAEILWGGATSLHQNEEALWAAGVWKPKDNEHFMEHDAGAPLPHVGGYGRDCERLVQKQQDGELEEGKIHTCTIFVGQNKLLQPGFIPGFAQRIQALDAAGDIRWVGLAEVIGIWQTEYDSEPNIVPYLTPQPRVYLPLILKSFVTPTPDPETCDPITLVDNSLYYEGSEDECWHKEDLPSPQPWFEETVPPNVGSTTTPLYFGIGVHIEPIAEYMDDFVYQQDRERLRRLAEIVAEHGGVLTIQTQTPFDDKAQELGDTIFADLAAQGHEIALHFHEDAHIPDADDQPMEEWVTTLEEEIDLIGELSGVEVRTWSGGNVYDHLYEAAEEVGLEVNINYKNPETQQSDERYTILTPWRPAGATSVEEHTTHDPDGAVIYIPSGVFPAHCDKLEAFPRPYCYEAFDYVTVALRNSLDAVTEGKGGGGHLHAFYGTLHPSDFFGPGSDGEKLQVWDEWLTTVVDPLVADGRIQWATMSDIADAFIAWEESCGE
jgi:hypothetical protein